MPVTADDGPLQPLADLIDNERQVGFFSGRSRPDPGAAAALLAALGPLARPRISIHVAGSEGKTSTTERLVAGLAALGLRTGGFTSPHLVTPLERLRIDGALPPVEAVAVAATRVREAVDRVLAAGGGRPTWFDALVAVARILHETLAVDAVVWETGLGGRLDSTRAVPADLCLITSISLEHTAVLGDTLAAIAGEKAGILRPGAPVVLPAGLDEEAAAVFRERAGALDCPLVTVASVPGAPPQERAADLARGALEALADRGLLARPLDAGLEALRRAAPTGRAQVIGDVLYDGAHSAASIDELAGLLAPLSPGPVVFATTAGRDALAMARRLLPVAAPLLVTAVDGPRRVDPHELVAALGAGEAVPDPSAALARARQLLPAGGRITVTGSLYLVGRLLPPGSLPC